MGINRRDVVFDFTPITGLTAPRLRQFLASFKLSLSWLYLSYNAISPLFPGPVPPNNIFLP